MTSDDGARGRRSDAGVDERRRVTGGARGRRAMATATATATASRAGGRSGVGRGTRATRGVARARRAARGDDDGDGGVFWIHTARARTTLGDVARAHGCAEETLMRFNVGGAIEEGMEVLIPYGALAPRAARDARATTRSARGFEEGARATGANIDWVHAVFFFAGLGIGLCVFGERGVRGRAKTRARDEGG